MSNQISRRAWLSAAGVVGVSAWGAFPGGAAGGDAAPTKEWFAAGDPSFLTPEIVAKETVAVGVSPDGQAVTMIFSTLQFGLGGTDGNVMHTSKVLSVCMPQTLPDRSSLWGYVQHLRGYVYKTAGARVSIAADLGGTLHPIEFPYDVPLEQEYQKTVVSSVPRQSKSQGGIRLPLPPYVISLAISVQRRSKEDEVLIALDTLDIEVMFHDDVVSGPPNAHKSPLHEEREKRRGTRRRK